MDFKPLLDYIKKYIDLTDEEETILISKIVHRNYLKDQYIVQQGDICKSANFIISGCTKTFYMDIEGQEHIVMFSIEDWWTSDLGSFITQTPADFNVQCIENTELIHAVTVGLIDELQNSGGLYQRPKSQLGRIENYLFAWSEDNDYSAQLDEIRNSVLEICATASHQDESRATCDAFLERV